VRTIGAGLASHIATGRTRLSRCIRLDLRDGSSIGVTDHDSDLSVNLGDGSISYSADIGLTPSAIKLQLGLNADSLELSGPIEAPFTRAAVAGGRFTQARVRVFDVRWDSPTQYLRLMAGKITAAKVDGGQFTFEARSKVDAYNQVIGRVLSPQCSHEFGVDNGLTSRCQATPQVWAATVSVVTDDMRFRVTWDSPAPNEAADALNGLVEFTSGELDGTYPVEVFSLSGSPLDTIQTYQPLIEAPQVGDTLTVTEGCDKLRPTCKLKNQILNFGGFPDLVGTDAYVKFPAPG
jgi:uncharacterized phage protein (TIGR02218 family)